MPARAGAVIFNSFELKSGPTKSQIYAALGTVAALLGFVQARTDVLSAVLPPKVMTWVTGVCIVGGVLLAFFNQSGHPGHVSIPVGEAKRLGLKKGD